MTVWRRLLVLIYLLPGCAVAVGEWQAGIGIASLRLADYRGSAVYHTETLPFPYLIYRGDFLRADEDGVRGLFYQGRRSELTLSAQISVNRGADDNPLREGMPALRPTFELGPALDIALGADVARSRWRLRLPVRGVFAFDGGEVRHVGALFSPQLLYRRAPRADGWTLRAGVGPLLADDALHDYYYSVAERYARPGRPAFSTDAGYSGSSAEFSLGRRQGNFWYGVYLRYDSLRGSAIADSPLVTTRDYFDLRLAFAWIFGGLKNGPE